VLSQLETVGLLRKSNLQPDKAIYELNDGKHHDHLICLDCGRVGEFHDETLELRQKVLSEQMGFELEQHAMVLFGCCLKKPCAHRPSKSGRTSKVQTGNQS